MNVKAKVLFDKLKASGHNPAEEYYDKEIAINKGKRHGISSKRETLDIRNLYQWNDPELLMGLKKPALSPEVSLESLEDLLARDKKREEDGFPRRIRIGKFIKPSKDKKEKIVVVPTTTEPKFYHDSSVTEEEQTGGSGEGEEGEVTTCAPKGEFVV